jgi:hypothetical protein
MATKIKLILKENKEGSLSSTGQSGGGEADTSSEEKQKLIQFLISKNLIKQEYIEKLQKQLSKGSSKEESKIDPGSDDFRTKATKFIGKKGDELLKALNEIAPNKFYSVKTKGQIYEMAFYEDSSGDKKALIFPPQQGFPKSMPSSTIIFNYNGNSDKYKATKLGIFKIPNLESPFKEIFVEKGEADPA